MDITQQFLTSGSHLEGSECWLVLTLSCPWWALSPAQDLAGHEIQEGATVLSSLTSQEECAKPCVAVVKLYHSQLGKQLQL